jgi:hypothetical protein
LKWILAFAGIAIALIIALVQYRRATRVESALKEARESIAGALRTILKATQNDCPSKEIPPTCVDCADVNGDGEQELLVQYPIGAHGSILKVFGWHDSGFGELATLRVGTPAGFEVGDFDGDGKIELRTEETDWTVGLPYATAPRFVLLFRWNATEFREVSRLRKNP